MKNLKTIIAFCLLLSMLMLSGCGANEPEQVSEATNRPQSAEAATQEPVEKEPAQAQTNNYPQTLGEIKNIQRIMTCFESCENCCAGAVTGSTPMEGGFGPESYFDYYNVTSASSISGQKEYLRQYMTDRYINSIWGKNSEMLYEQDGALYLAKGAVGWVSVSYDMSAPLNYSSDMTKCTAQATMLSSCDMPCGSYVLHFALDNGIWKLDSVDSN